MRSNHYCKPAARRLTALVLAATVGCVGGDSAPVADAASEAEKMAESMGQQAEVRQTQSEVDTLTAAATAARAEADRLKGEAPSEVTPDDMVGGKKITGSGVLKTPLKAGIVAKQKLSMLEWQQALQIYTATNNLDPPKTEEEFFTKVIEENGLKLEPLLEPYEYFYDVEGVTLLKRVKQEAIDAAEAKAKEAEAAVAAFKK